MARHAHPCVCRIVTSRFPVVLWCVAIIALGEAGYSQTAKAGAQVTLTGIVGVVKPARAFLEVEEGVGLPVKRVILREGERDGPIELLAIDIARNRVRIRNGGIEKELGFGGSRPVASPIAALPVPPPVQSGPVVVTSSRDRDVAKGSDIVVIGTRERALNRGTLGLQNPAAAGAYAPYAPDYAAYAAQGALPPGQSPTGTPSPSFPEKTPVFTPREYPEYATPTPRTLPPREMRADSPVVLPLVPSLDAPPRVPYDPAVSPLPALPPPPQVTPQEPTPAVVPPVNISEMYRVGYGGGVDMRTARIGQPVSINWLQGTPIYDEEFVRRQLLRPPPLPQPR